MELRGFEPLTPCMPCKCSAKLSYSPKSDGYFTTASPLADRGRFPLEAGGISPQTLQVVVPTRFILEEVHHHVSEVDQQPGPLLLTLNPERWLILCFHLHGQFVGQRHHLPARIPRGDYKGFRDLNELRYIEQCDVFGLLGVEDVGNLLSGDLAIGIDRNCRHS